MGGKNQSERTLAPRTPDLDAVGFGQITPDPVVQTVAGEAVGLGLC
jgi:hypothetical protein